MRPRHAVPKSRDGPALTPVHKALGMPGDENLCLFFRRGFSDTWFPESPGRAPRPKFPGTHPGVAGPELIELGSLCLRKEYTVINTRLGMDVITYLE